jgi:hypothetical protein
MNNVSTNPSIADLQPSRSTGPRTEAGRAAFSQSARKHDLCSKTLRLSEEWTEYNEMRARYGRDLQPANDVEETLLDEICFNYWRLQQARDVELRMMLEHPTDLPIIALYIRYRTGYERAFYKALDKLQQTQRIRKQNAEIVRSAKSSPAPLPRSGEVAGPVPVEPVRSAESQTNQAAALADQLEDHLLENRVRGELALPPLEVPKPLLNQVNKFVSQSPAAVPDRLLELMRKAA